MDLNALDLDQRAYIELFPRLQEAAAERRDQEMHGVADDDEDQRPDTSLAETVIDMLDLRDTWQLWIAWRRSAMGGKL